MGAGGDEPGAVPGPARRGRFELGNDGPSTVLVGVDGSQTAMNAAAWATGLCRREGAELVGLYVQRPPTGAAAGAWAEIAAAQQEVADELREVIDTRVRGLGVRARLVVRRGDPFREIVAVAEELRADAVVVGASGSVGHRLVGSIAVRLVRLGHWPVTVVP